MITTVVNLRKEKCDFKIGRNSKGQVPPIPEPGWAGNPYHVDEFGREGALALYKDYFYKRIEEDPEFKEAILALRGQKLGCFCKPLDCHGDVITNWLNSLPISVTTQI